MSHVFITGASGFIGRSVADRLVADGHEVSGMDRAADPARGVVAGDLATPGTWQEAAAGADVIVHTAALVSNRPTLAESWRVNTVGTRNVLDAAVTHGVGRVVYLSSVRAFSDLGFPDGVTEKHPIRPDGNPYVDTRIASEQVALQAHAAGEVPVTIVRPGDVYGPGSRPWTVLPVEMIKARQFFLPAMGRGIFSPVYVDDLVDGIVRAAFTPEAAGHVFTLAGGVGVPTKEFFGHYYRMLGKRPVLVPTSFALTLATAAAGVAKVSGSDSEANATAVRYLCRTGTYSIDKARRMLGYDPQVDLAEGMRRAEAWLTQQGLL